MLVFNLSCYYQHFTNLEKPQTLNSGKLNDNVFGSVIRAFAAKTL
jgi:hypothetical protein